MRIYVPENLDFETVEKEYQAREFITGYKRDKLAYILHQLNYIQLYDQRYQNGEMIPLSSEILQERIGNHYNHYLHLLLRAGIIMTDSQYIVKNKHIGYKLAFPYDGLVSVYEVTDYKFKRNLENYYLESHKKIKRDYGYLIKWFDRLEVNAAAATDFIQEEFKIKELHPELHDKDHKGNNKKPRTQFKLAQKSIDKYLHKGFLDYSVDQSGFRFHSILTNTRSAIRNTLTYDGKQLTSVDIKNSQPFFSILLFYPSFWEQIGFNKRFSSIFYNKPNKSTNNNLSIMFSKIDGLLDKPDAQKYIELVLAGNLYDHFIIEYQNKYHCLKSRDQIKRELFSVLFSTNGTPCAGKELFTELFPTVDRFFRFIKQDNYKILALLLQRIESDLVIEDICRYITAHHPKVPIFTIHDSITTTSENTELVEQIMEERFMERMGIAPKLKQEVWRLENLDEKMNELKQKAAEYDSSYKIAA